MSGAGPPRGGFKIASFVQSAKSGSLLRTNSSGAVSEIGSPENFKHHLHVDTDLTWSGEYSFQILSKLGVGYVISNLYDLFIK